MIRLGRRPFPAPPPARPVWLRSDAPLPGVPLNGQVRTFRPDPTTRYNRSSTVPLNALDSPVMEARDRLTNFGFFAAAAIAWILVAIVLTTRDPRIDTSAGSMGALLIGLAFGLTTVPIFWLVVFGRHRRIAYRGDWLRAARRGAWVAVVVAVFVVLRLLGAFQPPIALFILALVTVAEATLSVER
jgi:hypothetical protein